MSKGAKILLVVSIILIILCMFACAAAYFIDKYGQGKLLENAVVEDEQVALEVREDMFEYTVPSGYGEETAMDMGIMTMITIKPIYGHYPIFMLVKLPGIMAMDPSVFQDQMQEQMQKQFGAESTMEVVETESATIRGQEVALTYFEGTNPESEYVIRMMISDFIKGESGQVMIMAMGEKSYWDERLVKDFLNSIK